MIRNKPRSIALGLCLFMTVFLILPGSGSRAQEEPKRITFEQAFLNHPPHILKPLTAARSWLDDEHYLLSETDEKTKDVRLFKVKAKTGEKSLFLDYTAIQNKFPQGLRSSQHVAETPDYGKLVYLFKNDLFLYSVKDGKLKQITSTPAEEKNPRFSPDGRYLAYTRLNNLYALDLDSGLELELTSDGSETIANGWASWVYYEEILGRASRYCAFWWSPDSRRIAFLRFDESPVPTFPIVRSKGVHGELEIQRYPKAGDINPRVRLGIVSIPGKELVWADVDEEADHYVAWPFWFTDGSKLTFQWMNRGQDSIKIYTVDLSTGKKEEIYDERQNSWVEFFEDLHFFEDGSGFLLHTDVDGWRHLYFYSLDGRLKKRLTQGDWTVTGISFVDEKKRRVYFTARKEKSTETHLYRVNLDGTGLERLTREKGSHRPLISPGGSYFLDTFSSIDSPPRQDLHTADGKFVRNIDQSRTPLMEEYELGKIELFTIPTEDGWNLPATWILPPGFDEKHIYPVLFTIYGGPGSGTVSNSFPSLANFYLAQEGIIIISVDHRGSGHFGKKGISLMHRNFGKWEMHDYIEAVKWLRQKPFIDSRRIGITGGSYGGYTTCLALTYGAEYFTHGYARASVTDWRLYDTVYTERYMDRPSENEEGYEFGSVMTHADKLKGILFLAHGDMDDNVHMQNTVQLIDKFMDLDKKFEFMVYPNQRHGLAGKKREHSNRHSVDFWFKHFLGR